MKDFMKHLPLVLSLLTFGLVGSMWLDAKDSNCGNCARMRGAISQRLDNSKKQVRSSWGVTARGHQERGKRGSKKEAN